MPKSAPTIFIYAALPCEARPLIDHFRLKKDLDSRPFELYRNERISLTVTGIGKCAMAAGVAYTQAREDAVDPVLLNVGIAGHSEHEVGQVFLAGKIVDADTARSFYPPLAFLPPCAVETVRTGSRAQLDYAEPHLYDMEASAFYETAARFSTGELIQCLKVVSDNRQAPAERLQPKQVTEMIAGQLPVLEQMVAELGALKDSLALPQSDQLRILLERFHFTAAERQRLKVQVLRWECLTDGKRLEIDEGGFRNGKDVLLWLTRQIDAVDYAL